MSKFSDWLFQELKARKMSQSELARSTGLTRQAISYYLSEKSKRPDDSALKEIAKVFKIPLEQIYRAAGILPPSVNMDDQIEQIVEAASNLPEEDRNDILKFIEMLENRRKRK